MRADGRAATESELPVLAAWSSWGAIPQVFDPAKTEWDGVRTELTGLLDKPAMTAASRTTINAHYTDPAIAAAMWQALSDLGLTAGTVLEPGCGAGTFIGLAPTSMQMIGVELDPTTAAIAQALYPDATIKAESFAATTIPDGELDAAIGNVPFANVVLHDPIHNRTSLALHNHFIVKSLDALHPGGLAAFITSSFTLDATNPAARRAMFERADLLGAIRLPTGAHRRTAGTDALTDVLLFRRREDGRERGDDTWTLTEPLTIAGQPADRRINCYLARHPEMVLGQLRLTSGMYGPNTLEVAADNLTDTQARLADALATITTRARDTGHIYLPGTTRRHLRLMEAPDTSIEVGTVTGTTVSGFARHSPDGPVTLPVPRAQRPELAALIAMRDTARRVLTLEADSPTDTDELTTARASLAEKYHAYVNRYGPINRVKTITTKRIDPDTGENVQQHRRPPVMKWLRSDPWASLLRGIELYDETTGHAVPAAIVNERVVIPRTPPDGVDTPDEAVAVALDTDGQITIDRVASLLGLSAAEARQALGTLVFDEPETGQLIAAPEYLSGNIRTKLTAARAAAETDARYQANITALSAVMPAQLAAEDITPHIGAVWISPDDHQQFLREILSSRYLTVAYGGGAAWEVKNAPTYSVEATSVWGTDRMDAGAIFEHLLTQKPILIYDTVDGKRVFNPVATEAAAEKAEAIGEKFAEWVWADPARTARLVDEYNRLFNSTVLRDYTDEGKRLTLPGLAASRTPRPHQRAAVARIISEPTAGLFHEVGAGKTGEMVMGVMELRRLGMATKPAVVVPNHMLGQFAREWFQWYPAAKILAAGSEDLAADNRRDFVARAATGDWDAIIMTRSAFGNLKVSPQAEADYLAVEIGKLRDQLETAKANGASRTVKQVEKKLLAQEEKVKAKLDRPRDPGVSFEETGIDYLVIDEAHDYKNLFTISAISDAAIDGSVRAQDLHMKLDLLRRRHGTRIATFATATPIANSITEAHVMCRYLRPDLLEAAGVDHFDRWAATFGQQVTALELSPTGSGYQAKTRFARFQNVPEMLVMWRVFADVKTAEDLNLPKPDLRERPDGRRLPETVVVEPSQTLTGYMGELLNRAKNLSRRAEKGADNMLTVMGDGRKAALDLRLVGLPAPDLPQKLDVAADRITAIWQANKDKAYTGDTGEPSPVTGGLQLVFLDQSTPKPDQWNAYDHLKAQLIARGMPRSAVRFIHDAGSDPNKKEALFEACRSGEVAVLVGSTQKMGMGTNIQARAIALHHLDCPWRPADLEQRDGRILRQGNQNEQVEIIRYTTGRSLDAFSWQTVARKARFIDQVMHGRVDAREIEDIGETVLSLAETTAAITGDSLILDKAAADMAVSRYARLARAYQQGKSALKWRASQAAATIEAADRDEPAIATAVAHLTDTTGDKFTAAIAGHTYRSRTDTAEALRDQILNQSTPYAMSDRPLPVNVEMAGERFTVTQRRGPGGFGGEYQFAIDAAPRTDWIVEGSALTDGIGIVRQIENRAARLPDTLTRLRADRAHAADQHAQAVAELDKPFKHAAELAGARIEQQRIDRLIAEKAARQQEQPSQDAPGAAMPQVAQPEPDNTHTAPDSTVSAPKSPTAAPTSENPEPRAHSKARFDGHGQRPAIDDSEATFTRLARFAARSEQRRSEPDAATNYPRPAEPTIGPTVA